MLGLRSSLRFAAAGVLLVAAGCDDQATFAALPPTLALSSTAVTPTGTIAGPPVTASVTIINGTDGNLENLSATIQYVGPTGWLTATFDRTTATREQAATLQLRATPGSLGLGLYVANVSVAAAGAGNGPITISVRFTVDPRPPAKVAIVTQPSTQGVNGTALARQPVVQLLNAIDEPAPKAGVVITAAVGAGGGQLVGASTAVTDAAGQATFVDLGLVGLIGDKTLTFSGPNLTPVTSGPITLTPGIAARLESASAVAQSADAGTAVTEAPRVRVVDQSGNGVVGFSVGFVASAGSVIAPSGTLATATTGTAGPATWTLNPVAGTNTVIASAAGLAGSPVTFSAIGRVGPAAALVKQSGDNLIGLVGTALATPHVAKVTDAQGNGVAGVTIAWAVTGGGSVAPASSQTDANGLAQATRTLGAAAGPVTTTATATIAGVSTSVSFAVTAALAGPAQIVKVSGDNQTGPVGGTLANPLQVRVLDAVGVPQPNVTVTFTTPNAGGSFPGGASIQTDAGGLASTSWRLGTVAGAQSAQAAVGGPAPAVFTATATPGPVSAGQSTVAVNPSTIVAGGGTTTITVTARDANANPISGLTVVLAVTGAATLTQPSGPTDASGQATGTLAATVAGTKIVNATVGGVALPGAATVTVLPNVPTQIVPLTATAFTVFFGQAVLTAQRPSVRVLDAFGNGVPAVVVNFGITSGQSSVSPATLVTDANGVATVSSWVIATVLSGPNPDDVYNRLTASAGGAGIVGNPVTFVGTATVSFGTDLVPLLGSNCAGCHLATPPHFGAAPATIYSELLVGTQRYVIPSDSISTAAGTKNLLFAKPGGVVAHGGGTFSASLVTIIKAWIQQGAQQN